MQLFQFEVASIPWTAGASISNSFLSRDQCVIFSFIFLLLFLWGWFLHCYWGALQSAGIFTGSSAILGLGPESPGSGWAHGAFAITSHSHWVVEGCGLVDHGSILGVGADYGHNYSEATD